MVLHAVGIVDTLVWDGTLEKFDHDRSGACCVSECFLTCTRARGCVLLFLVLSLIFVWNSCARDGKKMSKSLKNYPDPNLIINQYGADATR